MSATTNLQTPWNRVIIEKLIVTHLVKKFPSSYGTQIVPVLN